MTPQYPDSSFAFWTDPKSGFKIVYSIALFTDVAKAADAGLRRVPHGGIEVGGILLGRLTEQGVHLEGFSPIACQYKFGPSFRLSDVDLEKLRTQLEGLGTDYNLADPSTERAQAVGFFVSHARGPLVVTDEEAKIFEDFFAAAGCVIVLAKPDFDSPPIFSFLTRDANGELQRDGQSLAIRVPVSEEGVVAPADDPLLSIPAPIVAPVAVEPEPEPAPPEAEPEPEPVDIEPEPEFESAAEEPEPEVIEEPAEIEIVEVETSEEVETIEPEPVSEPEPEPKVAPEPESEPEPVATAEPEPAVPAPEPPKPPEEAPKSETKAEAKPKPVEPEPEPEQKAAREKTSPPVEEPVFTFAAAKAPAEPKKKIQFSRLRLAAVLALAAVLGSGAGYWIYSKLPPTTIPLRAEAQPPLLTISWPAETTRDAVWAGLRIDNGQPIPLSNSDKEKGQAQINVQGDDVKIELIAQHWMRDSHGIVRFINGIPSGPPTH